MATDESIPKLGLGTYRNTDHEQCAASVRTALEAGYRHIDTAEAYRNEEAVGDGIADSDVPRDEVFLATKVLHPKFASGYTSEDIVEAAYECLDRLGVDSVDLFYGVHWPDGGYDPAETFDACATLHEEGVFDRLGVCNMTPELLEEVREASTVPLEVVQVELHPLLPQKSLREYCADHDITLVAYAPLGNGRVFDVPELETIATERDVSVAQVSLAWIRQNGHVAIPKATGGEHIRDNWNSQQLTLTDEEMAAIDNIPRTERQYDPEYAPDW